MLVIKHLEADTLQANTLSVHNVTVNTINGITPAELSCLKNSKENIQLKLSNILQRATNLVNGWK